MVFRSRLQSRGPRSTFVVHLRGEVEGAVAGIRRATQEIDSRLALSRLGTPEQHMALALFPARTTGLLFSLFGAVALLLAVSGLFGMMAYSVSQRTREIGIRLALGASRRAVLYMVVRQGITLAGAGVLAGLIGAVAATRLLRSLLLGIGPLDPVTFALVSLLLIGGDRAGLPASGSAGGRDRSERGAPTRLNAACRSPSTGHGDADRGPASAR